MAQVTLRKVVKRFDQTEVVCGIDLDVADKEFVVLVGPSGCGKSTTLRMIAGLEETTEGEILIGGELVNDLPPRERDIAMVFQNYALYPHMTVFENMSFGLRLRKFPKEEIRARVESAARILDITELLQRRPKQLSGGQRQRVAMGRAIVRNPKVFLFDEPLSNLDAKLRVQMRTEIKKVHQQVSTTTVYVTHDQIEAMTLADRVVVMNAGRIEQIGTPSSTWSRPADTLLRRGSFHRLAGDEFSLPLPQARGRQRCVGGDVAQRPTGSLRPAARPSAATLIARMSAARWCWACGRNTSPRPAPTAAAPNSRCRSTSSSPWAWRPWCISTSPGSTSARGAARPSTHRPAAPCASWPRCRTCT